MKNKLNERGYTLVEVIASVALFLIFAVGIYSAITFVLRGVNQSRMRIIQTSLLSDEIEAIRNLPYESVGLLNGIPFGVLQPIKTFVKNGMRYNVSTVVRNVDDPYDGTTFSDPVDTAPNDYKMVQVSVSCDGCLQQKQISFITTVSPKLLESSGGNGSIFIQVTDANGLPVPQANISIRNDSITPPISIDDTTGNDGWYSLIGAPTGTLSYHINVSKNGFSSDYTTTSSLSNPSPTRLPASVVSSYNTNLSFSIDRTGELNLETINQNCDHIGPVSFSMRGQKVIGSLPLVYKYDKVLTTNGSGSLSLNNVEWDSYYLSTFGTNYVLAGTIPISPFNLLPGGTQAVSLIMRPYTAHSLLVKVKDAGTGLPISGADVKISKQSEIKTSLTGLGYVLQTDWSGMSNQESLLNPNDYFFDDGKLDLREEVALKKLGTSYMSSGYLESSTFDLGTEVNFNNVNILPVAQEILTGTSSVLLQIATSNSSTPSTWEFKGPDGTDGTYYTPTDNLISEDADGKRYLRYRLYLFTENTDYTPSVSDVSFTYTNGCFAPGQAFFSGLSSADYLLEVSKSGYANSQGTININGNMETVVNLSP